MNRVSLSFYSVLLAAGASIAIPACASDNAPDTGTSQDDIIGGVPVRSAKLNAIGAIGEPWNGGYWPLCSGTLISPNMVLTAEHCVAGASGADRVFLVGPDAFHPDRVIPVTGVAWEDTVQGGGVGLGIDVGVMHLAQDVTDITPIPYAIPDPSTVGTRYTAVGYGIQDTFATSGTRRAGSMTLQSIGGRLFEAIYKNFDAFVADAKRWGLDPKDPNTVVTLQSWWDNTLLLDGIEGWFGHGATDAQGCNGDSGGPMTNLLNGKTTVFGVASWITYKKDNLCDLGTAYSVLNPITVDFLQYQQACPMVPRAGACLDLNTAERCIPPTEGGYKITTTDCSQLGQICGVDEAGELGCIDDPCEGIPAEGVCEGAVAKRCTKPEEGPRRVVTTDCGALGGSCGIENGEVACVDVPAQCDHQVCDQGTKLDSTCGACVSNICTVDPYCCNVQWDGICVNEVQTVCNETCPGAPFINKHAVPTARLFH